MHLIALEIRGSTPSLSNGIVFKYDSSTADFKLAVCKTSSLPGILSYGWASSAANNDDYVVACVSTSADGAKLKGQRYKADGTKTGSLINGTNTSVTVDGTKYYYSYITQSNYSSMGSNWDGARILSRW